MAGMEATEALNSISPVTFALAIALETDIYYSSRDKDSTILRRTAQERQWSDPEVTGRGEDGKLTHLRFVKTCCFLDLF